MRRTKIVCTLGPSSNQVAVLTSLIQAGMNVARLNFSHGNHAEHAATVSAVRQAAKEVGNNLAILLDTKGPEIRIGAFIADKITLQAGESFKLTTNQVDGTQDQVYVNYPGIINDVQPGMQVLLDDGLIVLEIMDILVREGMHDERMEDAFHLVLEKQNDKGRWLLGNTYASDRLLIPMGSKGEENKWITLRSLRLVKGYSASQH